MPSSVGLRADSFSLGEKPSVGAMTDEGLLMLIKRDFTSLDHERFRRDCGFLPEEREIFDLLVQGKLIKEIVCQTGMPEATVNRRIKRIKERILKVL